ncbi:MAG: M14 family zinc carboxypeptidase, partial [bacterium]|nr:M14 family zinc carboxypeptidase [bacterium]
LDIRETGLETEKPFLAVTSGQHPPETAGILAMQAFVEMITSDTELARQFRAQFNVVVFPLLNPDGADLGFWRHNLEGRDLNRDWTAFNLTETRRARDSLASMTGQKAVFAFDFHSTYEDVVYVAREGSPGSFIEEVREWIHRWTGRLPHYQFRIQPAPLDARELGAFTNWFNNQFRVPAVTYEVGSLTSRDRLKEIVSEAAVAVMEQLLSKTDKGDGGGSNPPMGGNTPPPSAALPLSIETLPSELVGTEPILLPASPEMSAESVLLEAGVRMLPTGLESLEAVQLRGLETSPLRALGR